MPDPGDLPETFEALIRWCQTRRYELQAETMGKTYDPKLVDFANRLHHIQEHLEWAYLRSFTRQELLIRQADLLAQGRSSSKLDKLIRNGDPA